MNDHTRAEGMSTPSAPPGPAVSGAQGRRWWAALLTPLVLGFPWLVLAHGWGLPCGLSSVAGLVLLLLLVTVSVTDLESQRVPNWATYSALAWALTLLALGTLVARDGVVRLPTVAAGGEGPVGVPVRAILGMPPPGLALAGLATGFGVMLLLSSVFGGGIGDVKLMAAVGTLIGGEKAMQSIVYGFILAGVYAACYVTWKTGPMGLGFALGRAVGLSGRRPDGGGPESDILRQKLPMAPFLTGGVMLALC